MVLKQSKTNVAGEGVDIFIGKVKSLGKGGESGQKGRGAAGMSLDSDTQ